MFVLFDNTRVFTISPAGHYAQETSCQLSLATIKPLSYQVPTGLSPVSYLKCNFVNFLDELKKRKLWWEKRLMSCLLQFTDCVGNILFSITVLISSLCIDRNISF